MTPLDTFQTPSNPTNTNGFGGSGGATQGHETRKPTDAGNVAPVPSKDTETAYPNQGELQLDGRTAARPIRQVMYSRSRYVEPSAMPAAGPTKVGQWRSANR
jgi:hypothetical protein